MKNYRLIISGLFLIFWGISLCSQNILTVYPSQEKDIVSPMIQGHGMIYSHDADYIYSDGSVPQLYKDIGTSFLRWPGGTVTTHYHWNNLNGLGWSDNWAPDYDNSNDPLPSEYMDLNEYMALCKAYNIVPMLGINLSSGMEWNRQADALQEAKDLIAYCYANEFPVKYFYLDNETYHSGNLFNKDPNGDGKSWTASSYANEFNTYAAAIKQLVPDAVLIANWSNQIRDNNALKILINQAGANIDYIDFHWYWQRDAATWDLWKSQTPMRFVNQWYDGGTFIEEINYFRNLTLELGFPHIDIASLEWNIAPGPWQTDAQHNKFKTALMQSEMMLQFISGGLKIGSLWSTHWPNTSNANDRFLLDSDNGHLPNPTTKIFELYKESLGNKLIESDISNNKSLSLAVKRNNNQLIVYVLSKADVDINTTIELPGYDIISVENSVRFTSPGVIENINLWQSGSDWKVNLKQNSLTMMELNIKSVATEIANGIDHIHNQLLSIYNGESKTLTIPLESFTGETHISLFSLMGQCIIQKSAHAIERPLIIDASQLKKGIYIIVAYDSFGTRQTSKTFIY